MMPIEGLTFDLMNEDIAAPAVLKRLAHVPFAFLLLLDPVEKRHRVAPRQLGSNLLHKFECCSLPGHAAKRQIPDAAAGPFGERM